LKICRNAEYKNFALARNAGDTMGYTNLESNFKKVTLEIERGARKQRLAAAKVVFDAVKTKVMRVKKHSGNLVKGLYRHHTKNSSFVGFHAPGYHAWLLEFGTNERKNTSGAGRGTMPEMPLLYPTFAEKSAEVEKILSEPWVE
jgi:hypothetical protein